MPTSIFDRGGSGMTRGGLDRYLGPEAVDYSSLPESIEHPKDLGAREVDCNGADAGLPICDLAKAEEDARRAHKDGPNGDIPADNTAPPAKSS